MSDYKNIKEYLNEQNQSIDDPRVIAFVIVVIASTVIPLHTQKTKFLAKRDYWIYFDQYRIKLNINQIRTIMRKNAKAAQDEFKEYIGDKKNVLKKLSGIEYIDVPDTDTDRDAAKGVVKEVHVKNDNMKYVFIESNIWWYLEYYLFIIGILGSLILSRGVFIIPFGDMIYQTNEYTLISRLFDTMSTILVLALIYYLDTDYRDPSPSALKANFYWKLIYIIIIGLLICGHVIFRYLENMEIYTLADLSSIFDNRFGKVLIPIIIILTVILIIYLTDMYYTKESFTPSVIQYEEEEKTIQDLIDEQTRSN